MVVVTIHPVRWPENPVRGPQGRGALVYGPLSAVCTATVETMGGVVLTEDERKGCDCYRPKVKVLHPESGLLQSIAEALLDDEEVGTGQGKAGSKFGELRRSAGGRTVAVVDQRTRNRGWCHCSWNC
jgi:hypothetical protein